MFNFLWNVTCLQTLLVKLYFEYRWYGQINQETTESIKSRIENCGFVFIKFTQWSLPRFESILDISPDNIHLKKLEEMYENCPVHPDDYTKELYRYEMNQDFDEQFTILEVKSSGSIGQVYKLKDRCGRITALKCIHPGIWWQYYTSITYLRIFTYWLKFSPKIQSKIFPIDIDTFYESLKDQLYFTKEADNMRKMNDIYKDNEYIIIPEVYGTTDNMLFMEYREGNNIDDIDISPYKKSKIMFLFFLLINDMCIINNLIHGDLHKGNWKVAFEDGKYKILLYDYGHFLTLENNLNKLAFEAIDEADPEKYADIIPRITRDIYDRTSEETLEIARNNLSNVFKKPATDSKALNNILKFCSDNGYIINGVFVNYSIIISQIDQKLDEYCIFRETKINNKELGSGREIFEEINVKKEYPDMVTFCETLGIFKELQDYYRNKIKIFSTERSSLFENCDYTEFIDTDSALME